MAPSKKCQLSARLELTLDLSLLGLLGRACLTSRLRSPRSSRGRRRGAAAASSRGRSGRACWGRGSGTVPEVLGHEGGKVWVRALAQILDPVADQVMDTKGAVWVGGFVDGDVGVGKGHEVLVGGVHLRDADVIVAPAGAPCALGRDLHVGGVDVGRLLEQGVGRIRVGRRRVVAAEGNQVSRPAEKA